jgi:hypothetical protein
VTEIYVASFTQEVVDKMFSATADPLEVAEAPTPVNPSSLEEASFVDMVTRFRAIKIVSVRESGKGRDEDISKFISRSGANP